MVFSAMMPREDTRTPQQRQLNTDQRIGAEDNRPGAADFDDHLETYRGFVWGVKRAVAGVLLVLLLLYVFLM
jgi:hypothetical protein